MMHPTLEELLDLRDGEGRPQTASHVESCPACAAEIERLKGLAAALGALPAARPARDQWPEIRTMMEAERRRWVPRAVAATALALAASVIVMVILPTGARPPVAPEPARDEIAELVMESQRLEEMLRALRPEGRVMDGWKASTVADLEEGIAFIDARLADRRAGGVPREEIARLWQTRVGLMNDLVRARKARPVYVGL